MKTILGSIFAVFSITAIITHIWTVIIAFKAGGMIAGIISLFLPVLSELYWMIKMFGENDTYAYTALIHVILSAVFSIFGRN